MDGNVPCDLLLTHKTLCSSSCMTLLWRSHCLHVLHSILPQLTLGQGILFYRNSRSDRAFYFTASYAWKGHHRCFIRQGCADAVVGAVQEAVTEAHEHVAYIDRDRPRQGVHARPVPPRQSPRPSAVQPESVLAGGVVSRMRICILPREDFQSRLA